MIYFTSDLHLGHENIIRLKDRPFSSIKEMDEAIITNYNSVIKPKDTVYLLGDLAHRSEPAEVNKKLARLNGKKTLLIGNHDKYKEYDAKLFEEICDYKFIAAQKVRIALMHYPMLAWERHHHGSLMLHGHIHSTGEYNEANRAEGIRRYDVGVDANHFFPVSLDEILEFFEIK